MTYDGYQRIRVAVGDGGQTREFELGALHL
jgi:hypothetical protein